MHRVSGLRLKSNLGFMELLLCMFLSENFEEDLQSIIYRLFAGNPK